MVLLMVCCSLYSMVLITMLVSVDLVTISELYHKFDYTSKLKH